MYLDESGNHSLTTVDPDYPLFVLGGIVVDQEYASTVIEERVREFKLKLFGRDDICLHTADITRNRNGFERMKEQAFRDRFYRELNSIMHELEYVVLACAIRKDAHLARYGLEAVDPYLLSLNVLVERFCFEIGDIEGGGMIVAEKRSSVLDRELDIAWLNLKVQGTAFATASEIDRRITSLVTRPKSANIAALQLADLVISPIGRFILGKRNQPDWGIVESKFRRYRGSVEGAGLVILPKGKR